MKRIICAICCLLVFASISACSKQPASNQTKDPSTDSSTVYTTQPNETTVPANTEALSPIVKQAMVSVSLPMQTEALLAEDGNVLLNYNTQYMVLSASEQEIADRITLEFLNRIDSTNTTKDAIFDTAKSAYSGGNSWNPYQYTIAYTPKRIDSGVLSLLGCDVSYLGAHIEKVFYSVNYSMTTGYNLSLLNIITDSDKVDTLCQYVIETLKDDKDSLSLYDDFAETVTEHFSSGINDAWFFSPDGLCFFFSPYDVAPYSAGVVIAEIPYERLVGILKDEYFPAERANVAGEVSLKEYKEDDLQAFSEYVELSLAKDKDKFLLYTDKSAYDIQIAVGSRSSSGIFMEEYTAFALSSLTPGDAIVVDADLSSGKSLQITYRSGDLTITADIFRDPETNQITFVEYE